jgi:hypothetical protein
MENLLPSKKKINPNIKITTRRPILIGTSDVLAIEKHINQYQAESQNNPVLA